MRWCARAARTNRLLSSGRHKAHVGIIVVPRVDKPGLGRLGSDAYPDTHRDDLLLLEIRVVGIDVTACLAIAGGCVDPELNLEVLDARHHFGICERRLPTHGSE